MSQARVPERVGRKDEFLATLAHELRNPLAPLGNSLHLMRVSTEADSSSAPLREMMERQVNHLIRLVDDLLEVSRIKPANIDALQKLLTSLALEP